MFYPEVSVEHLLVVVSGWIGIVIGYFFNQEYASHLNSALRVSQKEKRVLKKSIKHLQETQEEMRVQVDRVFERYESQLEEEKSKP